MPLPQSQVIADKLPPPESRKEGQPNVIIPSPLVITEEQETNLIERAKTRLQEMKDELGRSEYDHPGSTGPSWTQLGSNLGKHFARRYLSHLIYSQNMEWREYILGGLYEDSNVHLPITTRLVGQQIARANKGMYGTSPYFAISGMVASESTEDQQFARDVHAFATHQIDTLGNVSVDLQNANALAFIQGECVVKTRWNKLTSFFDAWEEVAVDAKNQPIAAEDGDYIRKTDIFEQQRLPMLDAAGQPILDAAGQPQFTITQQMVLQRDNKTPKPANLTFNTVVVPRKQMLADKVEAKPIYYLDFLCPTSAKDVQTADCCAHLYNAQLIELCDRFLREAWQGTPPKEQLIRVSNLVNQVISGSPIEQQALADREKPEDGQVIEGGMTGRNRTEPFVGLAEIWMWCDPLGDGVMRSIMILMTQDGRVPIYYDYASNLTPDGLRPFEVVRINPSPNSWTGQSNVERLWPLQNAIDLLFNRSLFAESRAARVDFWDPSCIKGGGDNPDLEFNWGETYQLEPGKKPSDALTSVYLTNIKSANLKDLLQTVLQVAQSMSAVTNVNDAGMAGMDTQKLATGIRNLENSGDELFHQWISQIRPAHESILRRCLKLVVYQVTTDDQQKQAVLTFFDRQTSRLVQLQKSRLATLDLDIKLELTTYRAQALLTQAQMAYNIAITHLQLPLPIQEQTHPLAVQILRALEIQNADKILRPLQLPPMLESGGGIPTPPSEASMAQQSMI